MNKLYYGDCLTVMQKEMKSNSVDLIYLDPPFNSNRTYNAIYKDETGRPLPDAIEAFCDLWTLDDERDRALRQIPQLMKDNSIDDSIVKFWRTWVNALRYTNPKLLAYLSYMVERLIQMKIILKPTGSIYLHCDPTYSHYIKVMMDGVFGQRNFRNEIVWQRAAGRAKGSQHAKKSWGQDTDTIFYYTKSEKATYHAVTRPLTNEEMEEKFPYIDEKGRKYNTEVPIFCSPSMGERPNLCYEYKGVRNPHPSGWRISRDKLKAMDEAEDIIWREGKSPLRKSYADNYKGKPIGSLWTDIPPAAGDESLGYPTQKPLTLLERIIKASSNEGNVVFDPFCGCATTLHAAQKLNRQWIGIDIAIHAIKRVSAVRLKERCELVEDVDYEITGIPRDEEGAEDLWKRDRYQFQKWAVEAVDGFVTAQRSHDGGIDGRLYFSIPDAIDDKYMAVEVKGGTSVNISDLRALAGVLHNEDSPLGGFITRKPLGRVKRRNFEDFCRECGNFEMNGEMYPCLQVLSIPEILEGKRFKTPGVRGRRESNQELIQWEANRA